MATQAAASLLDELMGRYRNTLPTERVNRISWESPEICKYYLVKFCPHELFTNTKSDLGPCEKEHDDELKKDFQKATTPKKYSYEDEFIRYAESMLNEVDRRIEKGKQRLALSVQEALANSSTGDGRVDEQIQLLSERITGLVSEAELLGSEGNVEEAQGLLKLADQLREERDTLRKSGENSVWHQAAEMAASQEKQMEVCEICGAFLIVGDAQQRIDDHLQGKQHVGYAKLRAAIKEIKEIRDEREKKRDKERHEHKKPVEDEERVRYREERRRREEHRGRGESERKDRHRDERRHKSSRERDHHRRDDKRRSRDKERRRSRSREHHRRRRESDSR